jgi:hypothetical protein
MYDEQKDTLMQNTVENNF